MVFQPAKRLSSKLWEMRSRRASSIASNNLLEKFVQRPRNGLGAISLLRSLRCDELVTAVLYHSLQFGFNIFRRGILDIGDSRLRGGFHLSPFPRNCECPRSQDLDDF